MLVQKKAKFLRFSAAFSLPIGTSTYVFLDDEKQSHAFRSHTIMNGKTPDFNTEGILSYDGNTLVSFEYDGGCLVNENYRKKQKKANASK